MTHTPGPWTVTPGFRIPVIQWGEADPLPVPIVDRVFGQDDAMAEANANLIAAAPDLLAALKCLRDEAHTINDYAQSVSMDNAIEAATQAIAKAEGRAQEAAEAQVRG